MSELTYFDIIAKEQVGWSPNTLKIRYVLDYKGIPYKTVWLSYPDIAANHEKVGITPNKVPEEALWPYTCAAIVDGDVKLQNGTNIIPYLEEKYPQKSIFPSPASKALVAAFMSLADSLFTPHCRDLLFPLMPSFLDKRGGDYFAQDRERIFGKPLDENFTPPEKKEAAWKSLEAASAELGAVYEAVPGPYLEGETPNWADFQFLASLAWVNQVDKASFDRLLKLHPFYSKLWDAGKVFRKANE